jgi:hypothetical protein
LDKLFERLDRAIQDAGYLPMCGQIVDASLVVAPRQRNTEEEKAAIKAGKKTAEIWPDEPAKAAQCPQGDAQRPGYGCTLDGEDAQGQGRSRRHGEA